MITSNPQPTMRRFARMLSAPRRATRKQNRTMPLASTRRSARRRRRSPLDTCATSPSSDDPGSARASFGNTSREVGAPGLRGEIDETLKAKATPLVDGKFRVTKVAGPNAAVRNRVHGSKMFEGDWQRQGQWNRDQGGARGRRTVHLADL